MSEDFDKEAERQRLREKYEDEREDREDTERMSELLLQGATMTNKHCDTCGNPIFRYEGQEFCPTCQVPKGEAARGGEAAAGQGQEPDASAPETAQMDAADPQAASTAAGQREAGADSSREEQGAQAAQNDTRRPVEPQVGTATAADIEPTGEESIDEARAALVSAVTTLARRASAADDPRRARDLLAAAREAAEALGALRGQ